MASLLIATADPDSASKIEALATALGFRTRVVATLAAAHEWLLMSSFDAILADYRFGQTQIIKTLELGWKHHPLLLGCVFALNEVMHDEWSLRAAGATVFNIQAGGELSTPLEQIKSSLHQLINAKPSTAPFRILLVEDLDSPRDIICAYIESMGFPEVDGLSSCKEALMRLENQPTRYSCIVTDLSLPGESGIDLIREVRRQDQLHHLPIIVLTAYSTVGNLVEALRAGASGFLVKPPKKQALRRELERARRLYFTRQNPRLCRPEDAHLLEEALHSANSS